MLRAYSLALKQRLKENRRWPIGLFLNSIINKTKKNPVKARRDQLHWTSQVATVFTKFTLKESTFINITILYIDNKGQYI